ncbi:MAG: hypothetical protein HY674_02755 [Chloroflexi bacterium]|nr:hypothetical protein [Chloroflexota bacterium]
MKQTGIFLRTNLSLITLLFVLASSLFLAGCASASGGASGSNPSGQQHHH